MIGLWGILTIDRLQKSGIVGNSFGSVGRVVASYTGDTGFESSHQQFLLTSKVLKRRK